MAAQRGTPCRAPPVSLTLTLTLTLTLILTLTLTLTPTLTLTLAPPLLACSSSLRQSVLMPMPMNAMHIHHLLTLPG